MNRTPLLSVLIACGLAGLMSSPQDDGSNASLAEGAAAPAAASNAPLSPDVHRSPNAVSVSPDRRYCATANHTADSVSVVDLEAGRVVTEQRIGRGPFDVAWIDDESLLVTLLHDGTAAFLDFDAQAGRFTHRAVVSLGDQPRDIALWSRGRESISANGLQSDHAGHGKRLPTPSAGDPTRAFIALSGEDQIAVLHLKSRKTVHCIPVGGLPGTLAVSPDGKWLATCCNVPGQVFVHDAASFKLAGRRNVFDDGFNLGRPIIAEDVPDEKPVVILPHPINRTFPVSADNIERGWVIDNRLTKLPLPDGEYWEQKQLGLDERGDAAGDPNACALSPDGSWLAVTCGGSHELLVLDFPKVPWPPADPGDFMPPELRDKPGLLKRVELGGRPIDVEFVDGQRAVVANYLADSLQIVDMASGRLVRTIPLGGPREPGLARRGEAVFYDADRSLHSWFSCHTCHTDGGTSGQTFDTLNDGNYDTYKLTPSLAGVTKTGPWTWHGWQSSLAASVKKSMRDTLSQGKPAREEDVEALLAFLATLEPASAGGGEGDRAADADDSNDSHVTRRLTPAARRGQALFEGKAGCTSCHDGHYLTTAATYKVGLESKRYFYPEFNPPSLRGISARRRFLHDGRADSLEDVLTRYHRPEELAGEKLTERELGELIAYLKSL